MSTPRSGLIAAVRTLLSLTSTYLVVLLVPLVWRHIAIVYDETTDNFRIYYDGALAYEGWHGSSIQNSDCTGAGEELTFGHDKGAWSWASEVELYDLRM